MVAGRFALFATPLGTCATVWSDAGITHFALPERTETAIRTRLREQLGDPEEQTPSPLAQKVIDRVSALLEGRDVDLSAIALDMSGVPLFHRRVYVAARAVAFGTTVTYGQLAERIDSPNSARAVGQALGRNPFAIIVPCHRIVGANGKLVGFTAHGGTTTKQRLLAIERGAAPEPSTLPLSVDW